MDRCGDPVHDGGLHRLERMEGCLPTGLDHEQRLICLDDPGLHGQDAGEALLRCHNARCCVSHESGTYGYYVKS